MSAFWASNDRASGARRRFLAAVRGRALGAGAAAAGLLAGAILLGAGHAEARLFADRDTRTRTVTIEDPVIRIEDRIHQRIGDRIRERIQERIEIRKAGKGGHTRVQIDGRNVAGGAYDDSTDRDEDRGLVVVDTDGDDMVRVFADAEVRRGEHIEGDVVAVFGSVHVTGKVGGNVVAVFGSVRLEPGATVDGDVVAIGGGLDQAAGAQVNGESVSLGFLPFSWGAPTLGIVLGAIACGWLTSLIVAWILTLIFPARMKRIATTASQRGGASFVIGVVSLPLALIAIFLLVVTVIGVPFAFVLPFLFILCAWAGQIGTTWVLGARILRRPLEGGRPMAAIVAGSLFVAMFFVVGAVLAGPPGISRSFALFFDLLGALVILGLTAIGTGAVFLSRFGTRPREAAAIAEGPASAAPMAPALPSAAPPMGAAPGA